MPALLTVYVFRSPTCVHEQSLVVTSLASGWKTSSCVVQQIDDVLEVATHAIEAEAVADRVRSELAALLSLTCSLSPCPS